MRGVADTLRLHLCLDGDAPCSLNADVQFRYQMQQPTNDDVVSPRTGYNDVSDTQVDRATKSETRARVCRPWYAHLCGEPCQRRVVGNTFKEGQRFPLKSDSSSIVVLS